MRKIPLLIATLALLASAWLCYRPGLAGGFLFDDYANLPALGAFGPVDNAITLSRYLTSGAADPTGRPLALASFLVDARDWPAEPRPFKRTNLLLHLANGALLLALLLALGRSLPIDERTRERAALLGAGLWLLHPLLVSTTLYVVQREAMLPATFILLGLLAYARGRTLIAQDRERAGIALVGGALILATILATLCKGNGVLLPTLAGVIEITLFAGARTTTAWRRARVVLLVLPTLVVLAYLLSHVPRARDVATDIRSWSLGQRLLTEPRVLLDYLRLLWLPHPFTPGLFNDQFPVSTGWLTPWTTLPAILLVLTLPLAALRMRHAQPMLACAILFFLAGHALEGTTIPLELYFEHRNYIPALLLFWPLGLWLAAPGAQATARLALGVVALALLGAMTLARASLWGNAYEQALLWARLNPASARAQAYAAQFEIAHGAAPAAEARLRRALANDPDEIQLALNLIGARCRQDGLDRADVDQAARAIGATRAGAQLVYTWIDRSVAEASAGKCRGLDLPMLDTLVDAAWANPRFNRVPGRRQDLRHLEGRLALARGDAAGALREFDRALDEEVRPAIVLEQAALLGTAGQACPGLAHLDHFEHVRARLYRPRAGMPRIHEALLWHQGYWQAELARMRNLLQEDTLATGGCAAVAP